MSERELGQMAYETFSGDLWVHLPDPQRWHWARVESAIRGDERAKVREECAKVAEGEAYGFAAEDLTEHGIGYERACKEIAAAIRSLGEGKS